MTEVPIVTEHMEVPVVKGRYVLWAPVFVPAPISRDPNDLKTPRVPEDLRELVQEVKDVRRFAYLLISGFIPDTTAAHLWRCASISLNMRLPQSVDRDVLVRMLWLHDLPEKGLREDALVIVRDRDPELAQQAIERELEVARGIFEEGDMELYLQIVETGKFLHGQEANMDYVTSEAIIAHAIDRIEGNTYFYFWITNYIITGELQGDLSDIYYNYTMRQADEFFEAIDQSDFKEDEGLMKCLKEIYWDQLRFIRACWVRIPREEIPHPYDSFLDVCSFSNCTIS